MTRDKGLLRELLLRLEALPLRPGDAVHITPDVDEIAVPGYDTAQIEYHLSQLLDAGYIDDGGVRPMVGIVFRSLTPAGHDFLDSVRDPTTNPTGNPVVAENELSEQARQQRFARWEQLGLDQVKHDLQNGGRRVVGGPPQVRALAWEWVRMKERGTASMQETAPGPHEHSISRQTVIEAAHILKSLGHSGFKRLLLELALEDTAAGHGSSLMDRANSLAQYALQNPERTVGGERIDIVVVKRAAQEARDHEGLNNVSTNELDNFRRSLASDGFAVSADGELTEKPKPTAVAVPRKDADPISKAMVKIADAFSAQAQARFREQPTKSKVTPMQKVFIVHGHDDASLHAVARFVEKLGFEAIILHERPNKGRTIITKFREEADVGFAVVLMTPDDVGKAKDASDLNPRARQNVVFELGFFIGALGPDRVAALLKGSVERPSDFDGVVYISLDHADWRTKLGTELKAAGFEFDWNKVLS